MKEFPCLVCTQCQVTWTYFAGLCGWSMLEDFTYKHGSGLVASHVEPEPGVLLTGQQAHGNGHLRASVPRPRRPTVSVNARWLVW